MKKEKDLTLFLTLRLQQKSQNKDGMVIWTVKSKFHIANKICKYKKVQLNNNKKALYVVGVMLNKVYFQNLGVIFQKKNIYII